MTSFLNLRRFTAALFLTAAPLTLAACSDNDAEVSMGDEGATMEREVEQAGSSVGAATEDGLESAESGLESAGQSIENGVEDVGQSIEDMGERADTPIEDTAEDAAADDATTTAGGGVSTYTYEDGEVEEQSDATAGVTEDELESAPEPNAAVTDAEERQPQ